MKLQKCMALGLALTLASSGMAFGQNRNDRDDRPGTPRNGQQTGPRDAPRGQPPQRQQPPMPMQPRAMPNRDDRRDDRREDRRDDRYDNRSYNNRGYDNGRYNRPPPQYRGPRGAGPDHSFYPGNRLPIYWQSRQYVVDDWRGHRLSAPPRGYHWVQSGGDYLLVAITTGIILQLLLGN